MDAREYAEWQAYDLLEPIGTKRTDYHFAQLCAVVANRLRARGQRPVRVEDFLLVRERRTMSGDEIVAAFEEVAGS